MLLLKLKTKDDKESEIKIVEKIVEVPVEVEKVVEKNIYGDTQYQKLPESLQGVVMEGAKHARRRGENVPTDTEILKFFE